MAIAFSAGLPAIIEKRMGVKDKMMVYGDDAGERVKVISIEKELHARFCLNDETVLQLANWVIKIEEYYRSIKNVWATVRVEWAFDGLSKELFIVQAMPDAVHSEKDSNKIMSTAQIAVSTI